MSWPEWVFSGIGVLALTAIGNLLKRYFKRGQNKASPEPRPIATADGGSVASAVTATGSGNIQHVNIHHHNEQTTAVMAKAKERWRWIITLASAVLIAIGLWCLNLWLRTKPEQQSVINARQPAPEAPQGQSKNSGNSYAIGTPRPSPKPPKPQSRDNSVHVDKGGKIEQNSKGNCSPNIVGGSNTVNCREPTIQGITVVVGYECQVAPGAKVPQTAGYMVASTAGVTFAGVPITLALQPVVEVVQDPAKPLTAFVKEQFSLPSASVQASAITQNRPMSIT